MAEGFVLQRVKKKRAVFCRKPLQKKHNTPLNGENSLRGMAAAAAKYMCNVRSCWTGRSEMRRYSRSERSARANVAKYTKLLVEQVHL